MAVMALALSERAVAIVRGRANYLTSLLFIQIKTAL